MRPILHCHFTPFPFLATDRLLLRQVAEHDANEIYLMRSNREVMKFIGKPLMQTRMEAADWVHTIQASLVANNGITWAITLKNRPQLIGTIGYWQIHKNHYRAEIGYMLDAQHQRKGIMHEAIDVVLRYGFGKMGLHSVEAHADPENTASLQLLEKNSFIKEAHHKENFFFNGQFRDTVVYSLLGPSAH